MKIQRWKHPTIAQHLLGILQGVAELADAVVTLGTLGFFCSNFEMSVAYKRTMYSIKHNDQARNQARLDRLARRESK